MRVSNPGVLAALLALTACSSAAEDAKETADRLTGEAAGEAADNPQCKLFTSDELAIYLGKPVNGPANAAGGTGCQWEARDEQGFVQIQVVRAADSNPPSGAQGFREVAGVGQGGYVAPGMSGWDAGAIQGDKAFIVSVENEGATPENAVALLKETLSRSAR